MTRQQTARALTLLVLAAAMAVVVARRTTQPAAQPTPQQLISTMLDAARSGDVNAYLACHTGQMEAELRRSLAESTPERFARYLKDRNAPIKGVAVSEPEPQPDGQMKVRVEYVYPDRTEAQSIYLLKTPSGWKISGVAGFIPPRGMTGFILSGLEVFGSRGMTGFILPALEALEAEV